MSGDCSLPKDKFEFPECWNNDVRMGALFAPFRSKSVNPVDWNSKMNFWANLIENFCKYNKCPVLKISNFKNAFARKGAIPVCLEEVIQHLNCLPFRRNKLKILCILHMHSTGVLVNKDNFMSSDESWRNWVMKVLVTNPLKWTFNAVKSTIIKDNENREISYVHLPVVKYLSKELLKKVSCTGKIYSCDDLVSLGYGDSENLSIVLHWMQRQGCVDVSYKNDLTLVKFGTSKGKVNITETDLGIFHLERQQKLLEDNVKKLEGERDAVLEETKKHLAAKMKNLALLSLRRKKELEKLIEKRATTLENIQAILLKIDQAKLDTEVIENYQKGIAMLKKIYEETGLSAEVVTGTMDELEELLNSRNEVEDALARPVDPSVEEDLEDELSQLLLKDAPEVPKDKLSVESPQKKQEKRKDDLNKRMEAMSL